MTVNSEFDRETTLDDVLHAFLESVPEPSITDLTDWVRRYPQYRDELIDFAAGHVLMQHLPDVAEVPVYDTALAARGRSIVRELLQRERETGAAKEQLPGSLTEVGMERGMTIHQLAEQAGLSVALWRMLDRRLMARVPSPVIESVARTIGAAPSVVAHYLRRPATLISSALHHADSTPTLSSREDFFEAVRRDVTLSEERRRSLLGLEQDEVVSEEPDSG